MAHLSGIDVTKYAHSPAHYAVACKDYAALCRIISKLPQLAKAGDIQTENDAIEEEHRAEVVSAVIDRRDVPGLDTPLQLAVKLGDVDAAEILMASGADWSLQNEQGWNSLQEAICAREEAAARVIMKYSQPLGWAKWCRRLPRIIATMQRMRDFYMEVTFHFDSSVIPFIARAAPSDTYRIWKCGSNLRADMTLAGFDGFRIQRSSQSFLFMGNGSDDGKLPAGSLCILNHNDKKITNAFEGADKVLTDAEISREVALMTKISMYRPGIDVTQAVLVPQLSWRWQEKAEMVGGWKAKVYDMHNVMVSVKSRRVPGAVDDEEFLAALQELDGEEGDMEEDHTGRLTEEEKKQLEKVIKSGNAEVDNYGARPHSGRVSLASRDTDDAACVSSASSLALDSKEDRKGWFGRNRKGSKQESPKKEAPPRISLSNDEKVSDLVGDGGEDHHLKKASRLQKGRRSGDGGQPFSPREKEGFEFSKDKDRKKPSNWEPMRKSRVTPTGESEFKTGLRPVLWLTPDFPLKTEELLPLLDILANKVKAVRRIRELLTTKLPPGTFPVKIAVPVVPTIRVIITFTKFEELQSSEEFVTPPSSPDVRGKHGAHNSSSWFSWIKGSASKVAGTSGVSKEPLEEVIDPFAIPHDYVWTNMDAKKDKSQDKKMKKKVSG